MHRRPYILYIVGIAFFCAMDTMMKKLVGTMPAVSATWWRYLLATLFTLPFWVRAGLPRPTREMLPLHMLRAAFVSVSAVSFFWGIGRLPLAQAVTIGFSAPLMIPPLAALILKERLESRSIGAGALGFCGVLVASGIGSAQPHDIAGVAAVALSAATYAVTVVATMVLGAIFFTGSEFLDSAMVYPLMICGVCILTSVAGTFFVKLGPNGSIMGALYKGLIATGALSLAGLAIATQLTVGWGVILPAASGAPCEA